MTCCRQGEIFQAPTFGLVLLVISCVIFDFAAQACFNPCESLIYDVCKGTPQEASCFFVYSFMTSFGKYLEPCSLTQLCVFRWMPRLSDHSDGLVRNFSWPVHGRPREINLRCYSFVFLHYSLLYIDLGQRKRTFV